jgi:hypothetical protein
MACLSYSSGSLISRIGMSYSACPRLLLRSGEHMVELRNTDFEKLLEVSAFFPDNTKWAF